MNQVDDLIMAEDGARGALAIICGGGSFPAAVADAVAARGRRPVMFGIKGWAEPRVIARYAHHWIAIGQAGRFFRLAKAESCREVLFIGTVLRPPIKDLRLDWHTIRLMPRVIRFFRGGDDKLLSGVAGVAESGGLRVVGVKDVAPELFVPEGVLSRHHPTDRDHSDIARALKLIGTLGPFDVGQAAVVSDGHVIAVEAAEGTDHMLARIGELRGLGRVTSSIGPRTIDLVANAGLAGLAVTAGSTMIAEAEQTIAAADRERIFVVGVREASEA
jgi:UDP-2,3-diacylglucosamine hydrolase